MILFILFFLHFGLVQTMMGASPAPAASSSQSVVNTEQKVSVQSSSLSYPLKPASVYVLKGMPSLVMVDGQDVTQDFKKLMTYTVRWNYGNLGKRWTNVLFQGDPYVGLSKTIWINLLFADGSVYNWLQHENRCGIGEHHLPFVVVEAVYGGKGRFHDVTRHFQLGMTAFISDAAIKVEKDIATKTRLTTLLQQMTRAKSIVLTFQGDTVGKAFTFQQLQAGWQIETTSLFPGQAPEEAQGKRPEWARAVQTDRILMRETKTPQDYKKILDTLPTTLKVIDNENKALDQAATATNKKN